jgi:hypothetical protein
LSDLPHGAYAEPRKQILLGLAYVVCASVLLFLISAFVQDTDLTLTLAFVPVAILLAIPFLVLVSMSLIKAWRFRKAKSKSLLLLGFPILISAASYLAFGQAFSLGIHVKGLRMLTVHRSELERQASQLPNALISYAGKDPRPMALVEYDGYLSTSSMIVFDRIDSERGPTTLFDGRRLSCRKLEPHYFDCTAAL